MKMLANFFKEDCHFFNYNLTKMLNSFFYFLRRVPLIKRMISEQVYAAYGLKSALGVILTIFSISFSFLKKVLFLIVIVALQIFLSTFVNKGTISDIFSQINPSMLQQGAFLWFVLVVIVYGFYNQFSVLITQKMIKFYTEFSLSAPQFVLGQMFVSVLKSTFFYLLTGVFYGLLANKPLLGLLMPLSYLAGNLLLFVFCRWLYMINFSTVMRRWIGLMATVIFLIIIGSFYYLGWVASLTNLFTSWILLPAWLILTYLSFRAAWNYPKQHEFIQKTIRQSFSFYETTTNDTQKNNQYIGQGLKMQSQLQVNTDEKVSNLKGSEYLNALLFSRYRQVFNKKIRYMLAGFSVVAVFLLVLRLTNVDLGLDEAATVRLLPFLFFVMYFLSFGKQIVQMLFVNCDSSMLYYPFYRESDTILKGFTYRLRRTFQYNSLIILSIFFLFILLQVLNDFYLSWQFFGTLLLLLVALGFLFSFHELFVYYLLQPFTSDMTVSSPAYKVVTWVFYYFAYMNSQVRVTGVLYVIVVSVICLVYVAIGLVVIYRVAPKTFKTKD
ncbi:hypothetical protein IGI37_002217 [Enterococcus sp. AZ194]|uniref:hypothetical protein n=1 Tax=Enterococcus sp. AZ194 TaxID=2774629 RepID=UPI003F233AC1